MKEIRVGTATFVVGAQSGFKSRGVKKENKPTGLKT